MAKYNRFIIPVADFEFSALDNIGNISCIVPFSGGKDSQTCLKLAIKHFGKDQVIALFCDTGFEHPTTYRHVKNIAEKYAIKLIWVFGSNVPREILKRRDFPDMRARFCTKNLKIRPSKRIICHLSKKNKFEVWFGMRAQESSAREKKYTPIGASEAFAPHDFSTDYPKYLYERGIRFLLPVLHWSSSDILKYLDGDECELYKLGFDRVGCFPCLAGGFKSINNAFVFDKFGEQQRQRIIELEQIIGKRHRRAQSDQLCMFCQI